VSRVDPDLLANLFFWMGLNGADGKPSNKRLMWTLTLLGMNAAFIGLVFRSIAKGLAFSEPMAIFGGVILAAAGGHYVLSEKSQLKAGMKPPEEAP
jgi:hypothetical protein